MLNQLPDDSIDKRIVKLQLECAALLSGKRHNFKQFRLELFTTTTEYLASHETGHDLVLGQLWLDRVSVALKDNPQMVVLIANIDKVFMLLSKPGVVEGLARINHNAPLLAALCLQVAEMSRPSHYGLPNDTLANVIPRWLGQHVKAGTSFTFDEVASLLYGPGVLTLYLPDVMEKDDLPIHLYRNGIPLRKSVPGSIFPGAQPVVELPDTMIINSN